jgi:hypothetical protein
MGDAVALDADRRVAEQQVVYLSSIAFSTLRAAGPDTAIS